MTRVNLPDDINLVIDDIYRQLAQLRPAALISAVAPIGSGAGILAGLPTSQGEVTTTDTSFTLTRQRQIFVLGTAAVALGRNTTGPPPTWAANVEVGVSGQSSSAGGGQLQIQTETADAVIQPYLPATSFAIFTLPSGTYNAAWFGNAPNVAGVSGALVGWQITVLLLGS